MYFYQNFIVFPNLVKSFSEGQLPGKSSLFVAETVEAEPFGLENYTIIKLRIGEKTVCILFYNSLSSTLVL